MKWLQKFQNARGNRPTTMIQRQAKIAGAELEVRDEPGEMFGRMGSEFGMGADPNAFAEWLPVVSTNVKEIKFVETDQFPLKVRFLNGGEYEYQVGRATFDAMLAASSKGKFVWAMRYAQIPYHRLAGGKNLQTVMYPFGGEKKGGKLRFPSKAIGPFYKNWATPGYHPPGTHQPKPRKAIGRDKKGRFKKLP